jgi:uncharacterized protein YdcH (DUF465 family)
MYENRIGHLEETHAKLNKQIDGLESTGRFNDSQLMELKKQRLSLRDQLADLRRKQWDHDHEYMETGDE